MVKSGARGQKITRGSQLHVKGRTKSLRLRMHKSTKPNTTREDRREVRSKEGRKRGVVPICWSHNRIGREDSRGEGGAGWYLPF